jgi:hypothetical protein
LAFPQFVLPDLTIIGRQAVAESAARRGGREDEASISVLGWPRSYFFSYRKPMEVEKREDNIWD